MTVTVRSNLHVTAASNPRWTAVCRYDRLAPDRGVAALVGGAQVAIFRSVGGAVHAVAHQDPVSGAHIMSRGSLGHRPDVPTLVSPNRRHEYDLRTGDCLELPGLRLPVYPVRCRDGVVEVGLAGPRSTPLEDRVG